MRNLADSGVFILMISSDMEEVLGVSDRIAVMREGALMGVLEAQDFSEEAVMRLAVAPVQSKENLPTSLTQLPRRSEREAKKELGMVLIFAGLFVGYALLEASQRGLAATFASPVSLGQANLLNLTRSIGLFGIFSVAMGTVIITGGIDLSVGSMFALLGVILAYLLGPDNIPWPLAVGLIILLAMVIGLFHGLLVSRARLQPFVVTLCGLLAYRGLARFISSDQTVGFGSNTGFELLRTLATGSIFNLPAPFILFVAVCMVMGVVLHRSVYGRYLYAIGRTKKRPFTPESFQAVVTSAYVLCALLTGISAILIGLYTNSISPASHRKFFELYAVAACVLGGCRLRGR